MNALMKLGCGIAALGVVLGLIGWFGNSHTDEEKGANIGAELLEIGGPALMVLGVIIGVTGVVVSRRESH